MSRWLSERIQGLGFSKIREVMGWVQEAKRKGIKITDLSIGRPDFDTPRHIKDAAAKALADGWVHYTTSAGTLELREAICRRFQEDQQLKIDPSEIIVTTGAAEAIFIGLMSVLDAGDEVLVPEPMYVYYGGYVLFGGAKCIPIPLKEEDQFLLKAEDLERHITAKTKLLILNFPHNPTGQVLLREDLEAIARVARRHNILVVADDIYNGMLYDGVEYFPLAKADGMKERTLIIGSFSKTYAMDGWRIGYLIAPRELISQALKLHQHIVSCPNTFVQVGAQAALTASQDCVRAMVAEFDRRRRRLMSRLDQMGIPYVRPRGAFYAFPSIKKFGLTSGQFVDFLFQKARVAVVPGDAFGPGGEGYVRISYCASVEEIEEAMERVRSALAQLQG
jgi:aspartate/methionine/tyrosine aminotransferase